MGLIDDIRAKFTSNQFEFPRHALDQTLRRKITAEEIRQLIANGEVIEDYPNDKYGPSCLIFGFSASRKALHIQCSHPSRQLVRIITVYEPDPDLRINFRERKK